MELRSLFLIAAAISMPVQGNAREATVLSYGSGSGEAFQMLEPGYVRPDVPPHPKADPGRSSIDLARDFAAKDPARESPLAIYVPLWMRGEGSAFAQGLQSRVSADCSVQVYRPHVGLKPYEEVRRARYYQLMAEAACVADVPVDLFDALIIQESRYNPAAISPKGAFGLTQLMPPTARSVGVRDRMNVLQNLRGGARYLRQQLDSFGNWALALSAYNAGPGNVMKYRGIPPFRETRGYVRAILKSIDTYQRRSQLVLPSSASAGSYGATLVVFNR